VLEQAWPSPACITSAPEASTRVRQDHEQTTLGDGSDRRVDGPGPGPTRFRRTRQVARVFSPRGRAQPGHSAPRWLPGGSGELIQAWVVKMEVGWLWAEGPSAR